MVIFENKDIEERSGKTYIRKKPGRKYRGTIRSKSLGAKTYEKSLPSVAELIILKIKNTKYSLIIYRKC